MILDIIIPVYRNVEMVRDCVRSIVPHLREIRGAAPRLIVINDSPDDEPVSQYLQSAEARRSIDLVIRNSENLGFVQSVNKGLILARQRGAAALLVNSDTLTYPGTLREMLAVLEADPQIGFVCPRSNNAAISTFPRTPNALCDAASPPDLCHKAWQSLKHHLPRYTLSPTTVGFYMLIADQIVMNFGQLDEEFGLGYEEENDLVMRAGKVGYRAALANHAYAYHWGSASFLLRDLDVAGQKEGNLAKMMERHPEFLPLVRAYEASPEYRAEQQLAALLPDDAGRRKIALNLLNMGQHHNGTNELIVNFIRWCENHPPDDVDIYAICPLAIAEFHGFAHFETIQIREEISQDFALAIFFGQPFDLHVVNVMEYLAPTNIYGMLDVIALDCSNLRIQDDVAALWKYAARTANGLFFISAFSQQTFCNRFARHINARLHGALLPTRLSTYASGERGAAGSHVFVMGNHFKHKASESTAMLLAEAMPDTPVVAMAALGRQADNLTLLAAGSLPEEAMDGLLNNASVIVLPSYYEGFGLGLVHALARGKAVVARDIPPVQEILATYRSVQGVVLFKDDRDLPGAVAKAQAFGKSVVDDREAAGWADWSQDFWAFAFSLLDAPGLMDRLVDRIEGGDILKQAHRLKMQEQAPVDIKRVRKVSIAALLARDDEAFVHAVYDDLLGRPADPSGLDHFLRSLRSGARKKKVLRAIMRSEEYIEGSSQVKIVDRWRMFIPW